MVSVEDDSREAEDVWLGASVSVPPVSKSSKLRSWPTVVLSHSSGDQLLYIERSTVSVHTNMHAVAVCFRNPPNFDTDLRILACLHGLLMQRLHTCSVCLYLFRKTEWLPYSGG